MIGQMARPVTTTIGMMTGAADIGFVEGPGCCGGCGAVHPVGGSPVARGRLFGARRRSGNGRRGPAVPPCRGPALLIGSGAVLVVVGVRILRPIEQETREAGTRRRQSRPLLVVTSAGIGLFTGLLANGGGFLLVTAYLLVFGLRMRQAVGTGPVVIAVLAMPTLAVH
jgi:hypothetical protein